METYPVHKRKILVVEDDSLVRELLVYLLSEDHEVIEAANGLQGLAKFAPDDYDVALIDLGLPGLAGNQVARRIKQQDLCVATVLTTAQELGDADPRLKEFDFWMQKPFASLGEVQEVVAQAIRLHDSRLIAMCS